MIMQSFNVNGRSLIRNYRKRVEILVDIHTQNDFLVAWGKSCVANHRGVLANIRRVMAYFRDHNIHEA